LVSVVERAGLDIVDAKILTTKDNKAYNTISILKDKNLEGLDLHQLISKALSNPEVDVAKPQLNHSHRYFDNKTHISLSEKKKWHLTKLEINTLDRVGVLSNIAYVLYEMDISLINARVSTMGERVEDVFFVNDINNKPLDKLQQSSLKIALEERL
jgi:[protein-PII] uridylyltransferase